MFYAASCQPRRRSWRDALFLSLTGLLPIGIALLVIIAQKTNWQTAPSSAGFTISADGNWLVTLVKAVGWFYGPLLLWLVLMLAALLSLLGLELRIKRVIPPAFVEEFTDTVNQRRFKDAFDLARGESSLVGRIITAGMGRLQFGIEDARYALRETGEILGKKLPLLYLGMIAAISAFLGLIGLLWNAIYSLQELGLANQNGFIVFLSSGLMVLLIGVCLSGVAVCGYLFFRRRLSIILLEAQNIADDLITQMYHNSRSRSTPWKKEPPDEGPEDLGRLAPTKPPPSGLSGSERATPEIE